MRHYKYVDISVHSRSGFFSWFGLCPLVPSQWKSLANNDISDNIAVPILCQQFVFVSLLFKHDNAPTHKTQTIKKWFYKLVVEDLHWPAQNPDLNPM